jgi:hypothetical protein
VTDEYDDDQATEYESVESVVTDHLAPMIRRRLTGSVTWCASWWAHPEAVDRLTALWRAWEALHAAPGVGLSTWWLNHADPHLDRLMDAQCGPFAGCRDGHSDKLEALPVRSSTLRAPTPRGTTLSPAGR